MSKLVAEYTFSGATIGATATYDPTKLILGSLMRNNSGNSVGPLLPQLSAPNDVNANVYHSYPCAYKWSDRYHWIFGAELTSASGTRKIALWQHDLLLNMLSYIGFITLNFSKLSGNKTSKGLYVEVTRESTGTVGTAGAPSSTINGASTKFVENGIAVGARIGFGSTDPSQITSWYPISSITDDTTLAISTPVTVANGTAYVIEEIRICYAFTNGTTATFGGLALVKGINFNDFRPGGTNIAEGTTAGGDNKKAVYFLKDAATTNMTIVNGIAASLTSSMTSHNVYCLNADANSLARIYQFDIRASLTMQAYGFHVTNAFVQRTGQYTTTGQTIAQNGGNGAIFAVTHGGASGDPSFWFVAGSKIYRAPLASILAASTTYVADSMVENPPLGTNTFASSSGTLNNLMYCPDIDRLFVAFTASPVRVYSTTYDVAVSATADRLFMVDSMRVNGFALSDRWSPSNAAQTRSGVPQMATVGGVLYSFITSGSGTINVLHSSVPCADWQYGLTTNQFVITPKIALTGARALYKAYTIDKHFDGTAGLSIGTEPFETYYRVHGINDNSGSWTLLGPSGDLSGVTGVTSGSHIQFRFLYRLMGEACSPVQTYAVACAYEDHSPVSHYIAVPSKSNLGTTVFVWRQQTYWCSEIPNLELAFKNFDNGLTYYTDTTLNPTGGTFSYSMNGTTWLPWSTTADNVGNFIRYEAGPTGLSGATGQIRATLRQYISN